MCLLEMLKDRIEDSNEMNGAGDTLWPASIKSLVGPGGALDLFTRVLEDIITKLVPQDSLHRPLKPFTWPYNKNDIIEMLIS